MQFLNLLFIAAPLIASAHRPLIHKACAIPASTTGIQVMGTCVKLEGSRPGRIHTLCLDKKQLLGDVVYTYELLKKKGPAADISVIEPVVTMTVTPRQKYTTPEPGPTAYFAVVYHCKVYANGKAVDVVMSDAFYQVQLGSKTEGYNSHTFRSNDFGCETPSITWVRLPDNAKCAWS